jgi:hypothetical protein
MQECLRIPETKAQKRRSGLLRKRLISNGAPSRSRTGTSFRTTDFKSGVSTNFTIRAVALLMLDSHEQCREVS